MLMKVFVSIDAASIALGMYSPAPVEPFLLLVTSLAIGWMLQASPCSSLSY
jgi:hypothetical protein